MKFNLDLNSVKYIKIIYKDINGRLSSTKAALKSIDNREIMACRKFEDGIQAETPQNITLSIVCSDGLYQTKTVLKSIENDEPYTFFYLETPSTIDYQQNREYFRVSVDYDCIYSTSSYYETKQIKTRTFDISANGISLIFPVHEVSMENARLYLTIDNRDIEVNLKFVRSEKIDKGYKFSFMFSKISNADQDFIAQTCIQKQLEQRRRSIF